MSGTKAGQIGRWDRERQAAMSFTEIGSALGISRRDAYTAYRSAIRKMRMRQRVIAQMAAMASELEKNRRSECE
ncbi:MAG: hypothetical protein ACYCPO_06615 [Acidobacteriaceae bacterium]